MKILRPTFRQRICYTTHIHVGLQRKGQRWSIIFNRHRLSTHSGRICGCNTATDLATETRHRAETNGASARLPSQAAPSVNLHSYSGLSKYKALAGSHRPLTMTLSDWSQMDPRLKGVAKSAHRSCDWAMYGIRGVEYSPPGVCASVVWSYPCISRRQCSAPKTVYPVQSGSYQEGENSEYCETALGHAISFFAEAY